MKKIKKIGIVTGVLCLIIVGIFVAFDLYSKTVSNNVDIQTTDASGVPDGVYTGSYEIAPVKVSVQVTVAEEMITDISILEHQTGLGSKAEAIIDQVIQNQSLEVDAVSGATTSSKTILKAIENALQSGGR